MVTSPVLAWRTGAQTITYTIVEHCFFLAMILIYLLTAIAVMFAAPDFRHHNYAFLHGVLVGFSYPFALFMIGESSAWWSAPSATFAGVSVLSAVMGGLIFCGIFIYWTLLSRPSAEKVTVSARWFTKGFKAFELSIALIWSIATLASAICMLWLIIKVQSQQGFALIINAVAYISVLIYAYLVRLHYLKTHLALGALFGASLALVFMSGKWVFNFVSRYMGNVADPWSGLYIATFSFNAAMVATTIPLLVAWSLMEAKSNGGREGEGHYGAGAAALPA